MLDNDYLNYTFLTVFLSLFLYFCYIIYKETTKLVTYIKDTKNTLEPIRDGVTNVNDILKNNTENITNGIGSISSTLQSIEKVVSTFMNNLKNSGKPKVNVNEIKTE